MKDPLTSALSRQSFEQEFKKASMEAQLGSDNLSLAFIDLDHFKSINDAFGHRRGDEILIEFSDRLKSMIRDSDQLFRYGGDEFILLMPFTLKEQSIIALRRIHECLNSMEFPGNPPVHVDFSIGISSYPEDCIDATQLFEIADQRLLEAKYRGRKLIISEDLSSDDDFHFDDVSRIIEREQALHDSRQCLNHLPQIRRGVLVVLGPSGSGLSRMLSEVRKEANLRGYETIWLTADAAIKLVPFGALAESDAPWCSRSDHNTSVRMLLKAFINHHNEDSTRPCVFLVDNMQYLDYHTVELMNSLVDLNTELPVGLIYTSSIPDPRISTTCPFKTVELKPLTMPGVKIWLRSFLRWEPADPFLRWLFRETNGLPGNIQKSISYLIKRGILKKSSENTWSLSDTYRELHLQQRLGLQTNQRNSNLPTKLADFVGREQELANIRTLLKSKRLITLTGPGGIGKTRLALQGGWLELDRFIDGVFIASLASITSKEFLISALADAIGFTFFGDQDPEVQLFSYLQDKNMLLIVDSFDYFISNAELLNEILEMCSQIYILVTSREVLNLQGEWIYEIKGLPVPDINSESPEMYHAFQLFLLGAQRVDSKFNATAENIPDIIRICQLTGGMPLSLELASAWVSVLNCREIADEIEKSLDFLRSTQGNLPERHRSLRAVFEQSWRMIKEEERQIFQRMTIFRGGFDKNAANEIAEAPVSVLLSLKSKSLIYRSESNRYYILESLRQYGEQKLEDIQDEARRIQRKHSLYYADLVRSMYAEINDANKIISAMSSDIENIREGWKHAVMAGELDCIAGYLPSLFHYYDIAGPYSEGYHLLDFAADYFQNVSINASTMEFERIKAKLLNFKGYFAFQLARYTDAGCIFKDALSISKRIHDSQMAADAFDGLGKVARRLGRCDEARNYHEQSLVIRQKINDRVGLTQTLHRLANVLNFLGQNEEAQDLLEQSLGIARELQDERQEANVLVDLGICMGKLGRVDIQRNYLRQSLQIRKRLHDTPGVASSLDILAYVEKFFGNYDLAREMLQESLEIRKKIGDRWGIAASQLNMSDIQKLTGKFREASEAVEECLAIFKDIHYQRGIARAMNRKGEIIRFMNGSLESISYFEDSCRIFEVIQDRSGIVHCKRNLGYSYLDSKDYETAEKYFQESLAMSSTLYPIQSRIEGLLALATLKADQDPEDQMLALQILQAIMKQSSLSASSRLSACKIISTLSSRFQNDELKKVIHGDDDINLVIAFLTKSN